MRLLFALPLVIPLVLYVAWKLYVRWAWPGGYKKLPGPEPSFLLGNVLEIVKCGNVQNFQRDVLMKGGYLKDGVAVFWLFSQPFVVVTRPDYAKKVLLSTKRTLQSWEIALFGGASLFHLSGPEWSTRRRMVLPYFGPKYAANFVQCTGQCIPVLYDIMDSKTDQSFNILPCLKLVGIDIMGLSSFEYDFKGRYQNTTSSNAVRAFDDMLALHQRVLTSLLGKMKFWLLKSDHAKTLGKIYGLIDTVISERLKEGKNAQHYDFLQVLLDNVDNGLITIDDVKKELFVFILAGYDTSSTTASIFLHHMAENPKIQDQVVVELKKELKEKAPQDIEIDDLARLVYLDSCLAESMRVQSVAPATGRELQKPIVLNGVEVPAGTFAWAGIWAMAHDPAVWGSNVDEFNPENFSPKLGEGKSTAVYTMGTRSVTSLEEDKANDDNSSTEARPEQGRPIGTRERDYLLRFGGGPKSCVGARFALLELKHLLAAILSRYEVSLPDPKQKMRIVDKFLTSPAEVNLIFKRRK